MALSPQEQAILQAAASIAGGFASSPFWWDIAKGRVRQGTAPPAPDQYKRMLAEDTVEALNLLILELGFTP